ncbi:MAG: thioredoxin domain-containing protein [Ancrocorticia sp.]
MSQDNSPFTPASQGTSPASGAGGAGGELPGVSLPPATPVKRTNTLVVSLVAVVAILVVALIFALIRPWDRSGSETPAPAPTSSAASGNDDGAAAGPSAASGSATQPEMDDFQRREAEIAERLGLSAGQDYALSQPEGGRTVIASIPQAAADSGRTLGPDSAAVRIHVFGDFSCPMCTKLHIESMPELEQMARDGKIQLQWHNFVIFPDYGSDKAARGAVAASHQGKLWEFADAAFGSAESGGHPEYSDDSVLELARQAGVGDMDKFLADYNDAATQKEIDDERVLAGQTLGLTGTPVMFINSAYMSGAYPLDLILNTIKIQEELTKG